jgi:hypothetical protein
VALWRAVEGNVKGTIWRVLGSIAVASAASPAAAQAVPTLRAEVPPGCPGETAIRADLVALLGSSTPALDPGSTVDVVIAASLEGGFVLRLDGGALGERTLAGESCAALAQAAALLVAWMIDPTAPAPELPVAVASTTVAEAAPVVAALAEPIGTAVAGTVARAASEVPAARPSTAAIELAAPDHTPASVRRGPVTSVGIGATVLGDLGSLPSASPGIGGEVVVRIDRLDLRARGGWLATQSAGVTNTGAPAGAAVEIEYAGGSIAGCGRPLEDGPSLAICGAVHGGALIARGVGVTSPSRAEIGIAALGVGVALPWVPDPHVDLEIAAELLIPLSQPTFVLAPFGSVFTPAPVSGRLSLTGHIDVR